ncbi:MAG TPA: cobyrinate a,c-diamide synthase [Candidatus Binataceae bacterium]|nr:cobyrinate a,c-diamide synthase [Candidatus Binataceae bacterium]
MVPRIVIAATGSGVGKTTIAVGLLLALRTRGLRVVAFKCGPDYLDPTYHEKASGCRSHNLDGWMMGRDGVLGTFRHATRGADIAIIEGMMGLFDSVAPTTDEGSTAEIAKWLDAPVLLVTDVSGLARTIAAIAQGFARFDSSVRLAGIVANRVGGRGHLELLREASPEVPVVGGLPDRSEGAFPERHLGLISARDARVDDASFANWGSLCADWFDLEQVLRIARSVPSLESDARSPATRLAPENPRCSIGVARDEAFHFYYEYNLACLERLGAQIIHFSPLHDRELPIVDGIYLGGGYPEAHAKELAENRSMTDSIRRFAQSGRPIYAECGGLMYLFDGIRTLHGITHRQTGLLPGIAVMRESLQAIGYADVETVGESFLGPVGTRLRGHQFRYSILDPEPDEAVERIYRVTPRWGGAPFAEGYRCANVIGSYVHAHWASNPEVARNFVDACAKWRLAN